MNQKLAETDDNGLKSLFRKEVAETQASELRQLSAYLQNGSIRPPEWDAWLQKTASNTHESMQMVASITDVKAVPDGYTQDQVLEEFRTKLTGFGKALKAWRQILKQAKEASTIVVSQA